MEEAGFTPVAPGIRAIRLPVPQPVGAVNAYAIGEPPEILIDCGTCSPSSIAILKTVLPAGPRVIIATHHHADHYGGSGALQREWGCEVWMSAEDARWARAAAGSLPGVMALVEHPVISRDLSDGDRIEAGGREYHVLITPGHTLGHVCLMEANGEAVFAGDHLLPRITPHIGLAVRPGFNPVAEYIASLERIASLSPRLAYPGHGPVITDPAARARQIMLHHVRRGRKVLEIIGERPRSGPEVAVGLFGSGLDPIQRRLAVAEAEAHLEWLVLEGWAVRDGRDGAPEYRPTRRTGLFDIGRDRQ